MLSEEEKKEIDAEAAAFPSREAACIEALQVVQRRRRWVDDRAIAAVAGYLGMDSNQVDSVATFYNLIHRRPVGRHLIRVCNSVSCWIDGYRELQRALEARLGIVPGQTTADDRFTWVPIQCLGACEGAPALMIDEDLHRGVRPEGLEALLEAYP